MNRDLLKLCSSKIGPLVGQGSSYSEPKGSDKEVLALLNFFQDSSAQVFSHPSSFCLYICEVSVCLSFCLSVCLSVCWMSVSVYFISEVYKNNEYNQTNININFNYFSSSNITSCLQLFANAITNNISY